ncbi:MAG TPA: hypothetical protein VHN55_09900 [Sphingomicrobium sp.]|nr:hypothetical protein [Sphingomicrobium sp.]
MTKLLLIVGAAALATAGPALSKPPHAKGHGKPPAAHVAKGKPAKAKPLMRAQDRNRNGILDADEALARKYGGALCPPGLAKKTPACMPPGQAKRIFREGQRVAGNYRYYTPYGDIPLSLRDRYDLSDDYRYIYRDNAIYVVDPATSLVTRIIDAIL